jgi:hypothetical protein
MLKISDRLVDRSAIAEWVERLGLAIVDMDSHP